MLQAIGLIILGFILLWISGKILRKKAPDPPARNQVDEHLAFMRQLQIKQAEEKLEALRVERARLRLTLLQAATAKRQADAAVEACKPRSLDQRVLMDAINRENRAKSALAAVLRNNGVPEPEIETVIKAVDNEPDNTA